MKLQSLAVAVSLGLALTGCRDGDENITIVENAGVDETPVAESKFTLQVLHFADVDGGRDIINNARRFSAVLNELRKSHENTLVLSSGDNWIPGPEYNVGSDKALADVLKNTGTGRAHVAYLNAMGVQASAFGNHEFDLGTEAVAGIINTATDEESGAVWAGAQFPYLSANLDFSSDENLLPLLGEDGVEYSELASKIAATTVITVNGEKVGVVGATTPTLGSISSPGDVTILPENSADVVVLAKEIQTRVDALTATGINKVILLAHMQQIAVEKELAGLLNDVDVIIAGGSNTILADKTDRLRAGDTAVDTYPLQLKSAKSEPTLIVNTDGDYTYLGRLVVNFDENGLIIEEKLDTEINGVYATDEQSLLALELTDDDAIPEVQAVSDALNKALSARAGNVFGLTDVYLNGSRGSVRTEETNLGNLTAEANLYYAQQKEANVAISIKNGGGIRASIGSCNVPAGATEGTAVTCDAPAGIPGINNPGEISQLDLEIALRFNNSLSLLTLTGAQLKEIIEHGVSQTADGATPGRFPQVAGIRFSFDPAKTAQTSEDAVVTAAGSRVQNLIVLDNNGAEEGGEKVVVVRNGELQADAAAMTFRVVTLGYIAGGGDDYPFPQNDAANLVDLEVEEVTGKATFTNDGTEQDALAEYLMEKFPADDNAETPAYNQADTAAADDNIIQNVTVTVDTVTND